MIRMHEALCPHDTASAVLVLEGDAYISSGTWSLVGGSGGQRRATPPTSDSLIPSRIRAMGNPERLSGPHGLRVHERATGSRLPPPGGPCPRHPEPDCVGSRSGCRPRSRPRTVGPGPGGCGPTPVAPRARRVLGPPASCRTCHDAQGAFLLNAVEMAPAADQDGDQ